MMGRHRLLLTVLLAALLACPAFSALGVTQPSEVPSPVSQDLLDLFNADQTARQGFNPNTISQEAALQIVTQDNKRRTRVLEIARGGLLASADDYYHAAMVLQHGRTPEDFLQAHILATVAAFKGHSKAKWLSAATLDRFLQNAGRPQLFGTQYKLDKEKGWTQEPHDPSMHDAIRREYDVPPLARSGMRYAACSRTDSSLSKIPSTI